MSRLPERGDQLGMKRLAALGRGDPDRDLGTGVKGVLELRELIEEGRPTPSAGFKTRRADERRPHAPPKRAVRAAA